VKDVALLFLNGAVDYLGIHQCKAPISLQRIKSVNSFLGKNGKIGKGRPPSTEKNDTIAPAPPPAKNWDKILSGTEYLFYMMFIELDGYKDINERLDDAEVEELLANFQNTVGKYIAGENGRLWIWNDFGGIILFPFSVKLEGIVSACMRLMLSRRIVSIEQSSQKLLLSFRIVVYAGSTTYRERGKTGRIVSDAVNSLTHIGSRFAEPGRFFLSKELYQQLSSAFQECFTEAGCYENTLLYRMKLPRTY
jgi:class 3 adenylate cyclase